MLKLNAIYKELQSVPLNRLEEIYQFVHSLSPKNKTTERSKKKILSFGGAFKDMSSKDYLDFINHTKKTRSKLFEREFDL